MYALQVVFGSRSPAAPKAAVGSFSSYLLAQVEPGVPEWSKASLASLPPRTRAGIRFPAQGEGSSDSGRGSLSGRVEQDGEGRLNDIQPGGEVVGL